MDRRIVLKKKIGTQAQAVSKETPVVDKLSEAKETIHQPQKIENKVEKKEKPKEEKKQIQNNITVIEEKKQPPQNNNITVEEKKQVPKPKKKKKEPVKEENEDDDDFLNKLIDANKKCYFKPGCTRNIEMMGR